MTTRTTTSTLEFVHLKASDSAPEAPAAADVTETYPSSASMHEPSSRAQMLQLFKAETEQLAEEIACVAEQAKGEAEKGIGSADVSGEIESGHKDHSNGRGTASAETHDLASGSQNRECASASQAGDSEIDSEHEAVGLAAALEIPEPEA